MQKRWLLVKAGKYGVMSLGDYPGQAFVDLVAQCQTFLFRRGTEYLPGHGLTLSSGAK